VFDLDLEPGSLLDRPGIAFPTFDPDVKSTVFFIDPEISRFSRGHEIEHPGGSNGAELGGSSAEVVNSRVDRTGRRLAGVHHEVN
jgi:hypothetical protein